MPRKLIVFADGTGNSAAKAFKTNVWRLYQALDLSGSDQIAMFGDGVGTSAFMPLRVLGLALGIGVKRNVITLYKFLCRNYRPGDEIYGFGFSRGAFTIRVLVGLICYEGLISFESEEELDRSAVVAYRHYRKASFHTDLPWVRGLRALRDGFVRLAWRLAGNRSYEEIRDQTADEQRGNIPIHFLGLWDTVAAYGMPIAELTRAIDRFIWPMSFRDVTLPRNVRYARHALSLDDERQTFFPIPWHEPAEPDEVDGRPRLMQVWFAGVHANVGGGYPDDSLAHVSLDWMINEAAQLNLRFQNVTVASYAAIMSANGCLYDSRAKGGAFYRYEPRSAGQLMNMPAKEPSCFWELRERTVLPLVHWSVVLRMAYGSDGYVPISLPRDVRVLAPNGDRIEFGINRVADEQPPDIEQRLWDAMVGLAKGAQPAHFRLVFDTVWWRRLIYIPTVVLALAVLSFPVTADLFDFLPQLARQATDSSAFSSQLDIWGQITRTLGILTAATHTVLGLVGVFLPSAAAPWVDAIKLHPTLAIFEVGALVSLLGLSKLLRTRIRDRARVAWGVQSHKQFGTFHWKRQNAGSAIALGATRFWAVVTAMMAIVWSYESDENFRLLGAKQLLSGFGVMLAGTFVLFIFLRVRPAGDVFRPDSGPALWLARRLRDNRILRAIYRCTTQKALPFVIILICVLYVIPVLINRISVDLAVAGGNLCAESAVAVPPGAAETARRFDIKDPCWASGWTLEEGARYRIVLSLPADLDWFDKDVHTDVGGYPTDSLRHVVATPLKRWWWQNWFKPIARIGAFGEDEYALDPLDPLPRQLVSRIVEPVPTGITEPIDKSVAVRGTQAEPRPGRRVLISEIKANSSGELFLYVNDAMLVWPMNYFYTNNLGTADVTVRRIVATP